MSILIDSTTKAVLVDSDTRKVLNDQGCIHVITASLGGSCDGHCAASPGDPAYCDPTTLECTATDPGDRAEVCGPSSIPCSSGFLCATGVQNISDGSAPAPCPIIVTVPDCCATSSDCSFETTAGFAMDAELWHITSEDQTTSEFPDLGWYIVLTPYWQVKSCDYVVNCTGPCDNPCTYCPDDNGSCNQDCLCVSGSCGPEPEYNCPDGYSCDHSCADSPICVAVVGCTSSSDCPGEGTCVKPNVCMSDPCHGCTVPVSFGYPQGTNDYSLVIFFGSAKPTGSHFFSWSNPDMSAPDPWPFPDTENVTFTSTVVVN